MSDRDFKLSIRASQSYRQIGRYTRDRYGKGQMQDYLGHLLLRCKMLADGHLPSRSCRTVFDEDLRDDLWVVTAGQHYIIFTETAEGIVVIDFLHQSADIAARLEG